MEAHVTGWGWAVAAADAVLTAIFLVFGASLVQTARRRRRAADYRPRLGRFRWWLATAMVGLGVFFGWITLAWATVWAFDERAQAALLWGCAAAWTGAFVYWWRTPDEEGGPT
jgi:hypothetical protein